VPCLFVLYFRCASRGAGFAKRYYGSRHCCGAVSCCPGRFCFYATLAASFGGRRTIRGLKHRPQARPSIFELDAQKIAAFVAIAFGGFLLAQWCRVPMPHLLVCPHFFM